MFPVLRWEARLGASGGKTWSGWSLKYIILVAGRRVSLLG